MPVYDISGNEIASGAGGLSANINCKIIAHRGYHSVAAQNTIAAIKAAANAGFSWVEIDIRKTADGIYVLSHDATVTLYNNGTSVSVTIASSNYSTIKNYTWDSAGAYKLCTLQAVFNAMKLYDMKMICDIKSGSNSEIMEIAAMCGATDRIMLSYSGFAGALSDVALLQKYDNVPIRVWPSAAGYSSYISLKDQISNPIYADINATSVSNTSISIALACGVPIIFSGCKTDNTNIWCVLASGCMANANLNITYSEFKDILNADYDKITAITPSAQSVSVAVGGTASLTASSNLASADGYVYGFTKDPTIATVIQTAFGQNGSFTITGVSAGTTDLILFDGCGEIVKVQVTVS